MVRNVPGDRKVRVTQITTRYNQGMQKSISEPWISLKKMGYRRRRPHWVLLLSVKNSKLRQQFAQAQQTWTIENWKKVACSEKSDFCYIQHADGRVRIWQKQHLSCHASTVQAAGVIVWGIFSWHTLGPIVQIEQFKCHSLSEYVHQFMTTQSTHLVMWVYFNGYLF